jgi:hypothetical protein
VIDSVPTHCYARARLAVTTAMPAARIKAQAVPSETTGGADPFEETEWSGVDREDAES